MGANWDPLRFNIYMVVTPYSMLIIVPCLVQNDGMCRTADPHL